MQSNLTTNQQGSLFRDSVPAGLKIPTDARRTFINYEK